MNERTIAQGSSRPRPPQQRGRPGRLHRRRLRAPHPVFGRGPAARGPADRHARPLPEAADRGAGQSGRRDPLRAEPPAGGGAAVRAARARDAGDHRGRRHQPAAAADDDARHPADDHRDRAGAAGRQRRRRRPHRHRQLAAPAADGRRDEADGGREDLRRVLSGPLLQPRRRGSRRHRPPRQDRPRRAGEHQPALRRERPGHLRQHQPRADGRRAQVGRGRPVRLREPAPAPRAGDDPRVGQLHGSEAVEAEHEGRAPGRARRPAHERVSHRDRAQQPHVRGRDRVPVQERGRVHRGGSPEVRGDALDAVEAAAGREAEAVSLHPGASTRWSPSTRARPSRCTSGC